MRKIIRKLICYFKGHKPRIADNDDWSDEKGRIKAKWTTEYCERCYKQLRKIIL